MNSTGNKSLLLMFSVLASYGVYQLMSGPDLSNKQNEINISYEMARPKQEMMGEFSLDGREIDRQNINPFVKKQKSGDVPVVTAKQGKDAAKKNNTKKPASTAKKEKSKTEIDVVDKAQQKGLSADQQQNDSTDVVLSQRLNQNTNNGQKNDEEKEEVLSPSQWRALLSAQPTKANMDKLITAFSKNKIDSKSFYTIMDDLLKSQNKDSNTLAFYGLNKVPTATTFTYVAQALETMTAENKVTAEKLLMSYGQTQKHNALLQVLQSQDVQISLKAAQVVKDSILIVKQNNTNNNPNSEIRMMNLDAWAKFSPIFQRWANAQNSTQRGLATEILGLLPQQRA